MLREISVPIENVVGIAMRNRKIARSTCRGVSIDLLGISLPVDTGPNAGYITILYDEEPGCFHCSAPKEGECEPNCSGSSYIEGLFDPLGPEKAHALCEEGGSEAAV